MKSIPILNAFLALALLNGSATANTDHLSLLNAKENASYRTLIDRYLCRTPYDFGRVIVSPSFEPEFSISIYNTNRGAGTRITLVKAIKNIYQSTDGAQRIATRGIEVSRTDALFPQSAATAVRDIIREMVHRAKGHTPPPMTEWELVPTDGTTVEWFLPATQPSGAQLNNYMRQNASTRVFVDMTTTKLREYCDADASKRPAIAQDIEATANQLLKKMH